METAILLLMPKTMPAAGVLLPKSATEMRAGNGHSAGQHLIGGARVTVKSHFVSRRGIAAELTLDGERADAGLALSRR